MAEFEGEAGIVLPEDQALVLMKAYESQARESGVNITGTSRSSNRTNENFVEQAQTIQVTSEEAALVDFLYKLGASGSAVRAKEISLRPDAPHYRLVGTITLAASFQRKINTRAPVPTASAPAATRPQTADAKAKAAPKPAITNRPPAAAITNKPPGRGSAPTGGTTNKSAMPKKS
jgi:hypothetical protein